MGLDVKKLLGEAAKAVAETKNELAENPAVQLGLLLGSAATGILLLAGAAIAGYAIYWDFSKRGWETLAK